jgi:hypothetical protein
MRHWRVTSHRIVRSGARGSGVWLVVYLAGLFLGPLADGRLEARAAPVRDSHVESASAPTCPVHDHSACQICRTVRTVGTPSVAPRLPAAANLAFTPTLGDPHVATPGVIAYPLGPRAPPLA